MHKLASALFAFTAFAALVISSSTAASAQINYPWCAVYSGRGGGGTNCGFSTIEQCRATISGMGGFCEPNQFYTGSAEKPAKRAHKRKHRDD